MDTSKTPVPAEASQVNAAPGQEERVWRAGGLEPMPIRTLPDAPPSIHILGPTVFLVALGVGMGESYMWPRLVLLFGPEIRWLFLIGVTLQAVVMLEMARYAMATGESIFFGAARVFKPLMWFFFVVAILVYIWPGHLSAGAAALEQITGIPWLVTACIGLVLVGVVFSLAKVIYNLLESRAVDPDRRTRVGTAVVAAMVGTWGDVVEHDHRDVRLRLPAGPRRSPRPGSRSSWARSPSRDRPACSRCGTPCTCVTPAPGMGAHIPTIRGLRHAGEEEAMPARGFMFDTDNPEEMRKWKGWRRWVTFDAFLLFWGITMLVTISFTVIAQAAARNTPGVRAADRDR